MANTTTAPTNKPVSFGRKAEREMSTTEKRKNAEAQPVDGAIGAKPPKKVAPNFRSKAKRAIKRGMISAKAAKKHLGDY